MSLLVRLYHFLGSLTFTLILFSFIILVVCTGTILESTTQSHAYAAMWTYGHPLFFIVFISLFANILFSATRRWPFKKRHIPFLMTHLGLLLLLTGVWIKGGYGLQGHMSILEGSGSHQVVLPNEQMIRLTDKQGKRYEWQMTQKPFAEAQLVPTRERDRGPYLTLLNIHPHGKQKVEQWNQKGRFTPYAMKSIAANETHLGAVGDTPWLFRMEEKPPLINERIKALYAENATLSVYQDNEQPLLYVGPLQNAMQSPISISDTLLQIDLQQTPENNWHIQSTWATSEGREIGKILLPLTTANALNVLNEHEKDPNHLTLWPGTGPYIIRIERTPSVNLLVDEEKEWLVVLGPFGSLDCHPFSQETLKSVYAIEGGFGGYFLQVPLPSSQPTCSPMACHAAWLKKAALHMRNQSPESLELPERLFQQACLAAHTDFATQWVTFLDKWQRSKRWLYTPEISINAQEDPFTHLDYSKLPDGLLRAMQWSVLLSNELERAYIQGQDPSMHLKKMGWPITIHTAHAEEIFHSLQHQLFQAASALPLPPETRCKAKSEQNSIFNAAMLSTLLRQRECPWEILWEVPEDNLLDPTSPYSPLIPLHCRLRPVAQPLPPLAKKEEEAPMLSLRLVEGEKMEQIDLVYDETGHQLAWPVLEGTYLAQCIPYSINIPYHVRLRDARKIVYPHSDQPASYEAECLITDLRTGTEEEVLLSMNRVHETNDGHRFYLSSISPGHEEAVRQVRLVVSRDPLRAAFTYIGGFFVAMGILLLLFRRP